jgi:hypothetical protein
MNHALHLADGDLIRYLDHQLDGGDFRRTMRHLARCGDCEHRLDRFREQSLALSALFAVPAAQPSAETRAQALTAAQQAAWRARRPLRTAVHAGWRAAAVVGLLLLGTLSLHPPLRAWVAERLALLTGTPVEHVRPAPPEHARVAAEKAVGSTVSFQPTGAAFNLHFENAQRAGTLKVVVTDVPSASAQALGTADAEFLVLPGALRIANSSAAEADYVVTLPAHVQDLQIQVGGVRRTGVSLRGVPRPWTGTYALH